MQVNGIQNYNLNQNKNFAKSQTLLSNPTNLTPNNNDMFQKNSNISFKGNMDLYPSSPFYNAFDIKIAKRTLSKYNNTEDWTKDVYRLFYKHEKLRRRINLGTLEWNPNCKMDRIMQGIMHLGISEIYVQTSKITAMQKAKNHLNQIKILRNDLINEKYREEAELANISAQEATNEVEYIKKLNEVKEKQIYPMFIDLIQREKEGKPSDVPNCVMISCGNEKVNKELVDWTVKNTNARFVNITTNDDILEHLELAEKKFQETGDWNLIHIKNGDKLINPKYTEFSDIESMKDIMSSTVEDYHTTLLFDSTKTNELDSIAMQPHRVRPISAKIKSLDEMQIESALQRLNLKRAIDCPINTINDLITVFQLKVQKLKIAYRVTGLETIENAISEILNQSKQTNLEQIFKTAMHKLKI